MDGPGWTVPGWTGLGGTMMGTFGRGSAGWPVAGCSSWRRPRSWRRAAGPANRLGPARHPAASAAAPATAARQPRGGRRPDRGRGRPRPARAGHHRLHLQPRAGPRGRDDQVDVDARGGSTEVRLDVDGLLPSRGYAAHAHVNPCGPTGDVAGPALPEPGRPGGGAGQAVHRPGLRQPAERDLARPAHRRRRRRRVAGGGAVHVHRPRPGVDRDPRGRDDRHGPGPGRLRRVRGWPASRCRSGRRPSQRGRRLAPAHRSPGGTQVVTSVPARCPVCVRGQSRTTSSPSTATE